MMQASPSLRLPIIRQFFLSLGVRPVERRSFVKCLVKKQSVSLFPGGVAEMFLPSFEKESIVSTHRGFIKVRSLIDLGSAV